MLKKITFKIFLVSSFFVVVSSPVNLFSMEPAEKGDEMSHVESRLNKLEQEQDRIANCMLRSFRVIAYSYGACMWNDHQIYKDENKIRAICLENSKNEEVVSSFSAHLLSGEIDQKMRKRVLVLRKIQKKINKALSWLEKAKVDKVQNHRADSITDTVHEIMCYFRIEGRPLTEKLNYCHHKYQSSEMPWATVKDAQSCPFCDEDLNQSESASGNGNNGSIFWPGVKIVGGVACVGLLVYFASRLFNWR